MNARGFKYMGPQVLLDESTYSGALIKKSGSYPNGKRYLDKSVAITKRKNKRIKSFDSKKFIGF